ncbi:MAG: NAD-glutamate dehydrogenase [Acidobacteria bacterium]|nr:NAD-glutamate dehydrogenase [Acidobacteriota bacterium]
MGHRPHATMETRLEEVLAIVSDRLPADRVRVSEFVRQFFREVDPDDLSSRDPLDLYGAAVSFWQFMRRSGPDARRVRVYNPTADEHGWHCPHTVIEIVHRDIPFLVDSVRMQINAQGFTCHLNIHPVVSTRRDAEGALVDLLPRGETSPDARTESVMHLEISRETDATALRRLEQGLLSVLDDVQAAVDDWQSMLARVRDTAAAIRLDPPRSLSGDEVAEELEFLDWLLGDRFTFLGCRDYDLKQEGGEAVLRVVPGSGLGILRDTRRDAASATFAALPVSIRERARTPELLVLTKSSSRATVHRPGYTDYVGIKRFSAAGDVIGERRVLGLYTSAAYRNSVLEIPVLRRKVRDAIDRSGVVPGSHQAKALRSIFETYPRDELFQMAVEDLVRITTGILRLDERQHTQLFMRHDRFGRFVSCLVYVPRDNYNTEVRERIQAVLMRALGGVSSEHSVTLSDSVLARVLIVVHLKAGAMPDYDERELEAALVREVRRWEDDLADTLVTQFGEEQGRDLNLKYGAAFPAGYREDCLASVALQDIRLMEQIDGEDGLALHLYAPSDAADGQLRFKLLRPDRPVPLSDVLPVLERMGARVMDERPYEIEPLDAQRVWIHDMGLTTGGVEGPTDTVRSLFEEAFLKVWRGDAESDDLNRLVLLAGLTWREIAVLRTLARYSRQAGFTFSQAYMESALTSHPDIARQLVELFLERHDPGNPDAPGGRGAERVERIEGALELVASLDEDRILRRFLALVLATTRTNYFQHDADGAPKPYLSLKFDPSQIPGLPEPRPMFEIYVCSPRVEGVHLRGGRVARGGLRWSDRLEDFRTEVLGLMKAQMVKNAVIVPVGAKGGFVVKVPPPGGDRDALRREGVACYSTFVRGLLDLTGTRAGDSIVPPPDVVRHDEDDTYLVVAADKGTATFSDIANGIAAEYGFWLGDAFASGGATGYDHKRMGITARGVWESVTKHFRTLGVDIQTTVFTAVGIGDMSGDVFGNGALLSTRMQLVAAFDHRHIFLDPDPDPDVSHRERARLFQMPRSSWDDYDRSAISTGGGVFSRTAKSIPLSEEVQRRLAVKTASMPPTDLIRAILRAPVDLLYNGGIGTYVKASSETHARVGDRSNNSVRVNGSELRCRVVGEGGNLGLTQRGRVEYALAGGLIYTDAIDNSAGVDCSDQEGNIKILLNREVDNGELTLAQRNHLLEAMTDDVAMLVLRDNYSQAQALTVAMAGSTTLFDEQLRFMHYLERRGTLSRDIEDLPSDDALAERRAARIGLTAPEQAVLLAYAKLWLFEQLVESTLPDDPVVAFALTDYFPAVLGERFRNEMAHHPLRREIIATVISNSLVNKVGSTFVHRLMEETGARPTEAVRAYLLARAVFGLDAIWARIDALDNIVPDAVQTTMQVRLMRLKVRAALWFLRRRIATSALESSIARFASSVGIVAANLESLLDEHDRRRVDRAAEEFVASGVPADLARQVAGVDLLYAALDICDVASDTNRPIICVAHVYFTLAERLSAPWLRERIGLLPSHTHWLSLARAALRDDLAERLRSLTAAVLALMPDADEPAALMAAWEEAHHSALTRVRQVLAEIQTAKNPDLAMLSVGLREVRNLV